MGSEWQTVSKGREQGRAGAGRDRIGSESVGECTKVHGTGSGIGICKAGNYTSC